MGGPNFSCCCSTTTVRNNVRRNPVCPTHEIPIVVMTKPKEKDGVTKYQVYRRVGQLYLGTVCKVSYAFCSPFHWTFSPWQRLRILQPSGVAGYCRSVVGETQKVPPTRLSVLPARARKLSTTLERYTLARSITMADWEACTPYTLNLPKRGWSGKPRWRKRSG